MNLGRRTFSWMGLVGLITFGASACRIKASASPRPLTTCEAPFEVSVAPAAPRVAHPLGNLALVWRAHDTALIAVGDESMVVQRANKLVALDPRTGRTTSALDAFPEKGVFDSALAIVPGRIAALESFVAPCPDQPDCTTSTSRLFAVSPHAPGDATTPSQLDARPWAVEFGLLSGSLRYLRSVSGGDLSLFLVHDRDEARAFDADGHELWRVGGAFEDAHFALATGRLVTTTRARTFAMHPEQGCTLWSVDEPMLTAEGPDVVTWRRTPAPAPGQREVTVRNAITGAAQHRVRTTMAPTGASVVGGVLLLHSRDRAQLVAFDVVGERQLWSRDGVYDYVTVEDAVYVTGTTCMLRALDPRTGDVVTTYASACATGQGVVPRLHASKDRELGEVIAFETHGDLVMLARAAAAPKPVSTTLRGLVRVNGKPATSVRVQVGELVVKTDATGHYEARVTTPGTVFVGPMDDDLAPLAEGKSCPECHLFVAGESYPAKVVEVGASDEVRDFDLRVAWVSIGI